MLPYFNQAICKSLRFVETPTWRVPSPSSYFTAYQTEIMLYSSFWRVGVNTNRSAAQPPPPRPSNRAGSNSSRDGVTWWESVLPPSLELTHNSQRSSSSSPAASSPLADIKTTAQTGAQRAADLGRREEVSGNNPPKTWMLMGGGKLTWEHVNERGRRNKDQQGNGTKAELQTQRSEAYASPRWSPSIPRCCDIQKNTTSEDRERTLGCS